MPTLININGYRFFFYVNDHSPAHIHIEKAEGTAKFLLNPVEIVKSKHFKSSEIHEIRAIIIQNLDFFKNKWDEYHNNN